MKKTWIRGLALSVGVTTLPSVASAQYTISQSNGLGASSFQLPPLPPKPTHMGPSQTALVAYAQQSGAIGSGALEHVHVPQQLQLPAQQQFQLPAPQQPVQPSQYQSQPYSAPLTTQPYESAHAPMHPQTMQSNTVPQTAPQTIYSTPAQSSTPAMSSNCPACASGHCSAHGTGAVAPSYGPSYGAADYSDYSSCGSSAAALTPSVVSPSPWIFGASGLLFNRIDDSSRRLASSGSTGVIDTSAARMSASGGFQGSLGRYFGCGRYAIVGSYWGVYSNPEERLYTPGAGSSIRTDLPVDPLNFGVLSGPAVPSWYGAYMPGASPRPLYDVYDSGSVSWDGSPNGNIPALHTQRIRRDNEFQNVELNFFSFALGGGARQAYAGCGTGCGGLGSRLGGGSHGYGGVSYGGSCGDPCGTSCGSCETSCAPSTGPTGPCAPWFGAQCSKLRLNTFGGVRWFRFGDEFEYAASPTNNTFNDANDVYFNSDVTNDLVGFQLGSLGTWCTGSRVNLFGGTTFGIYNNYIRTSQRIGTSTTTAMIRPLGSPAATDVAYDFSNSTNDIAFIGEGTIGTGVRVSRGITMNLGYRVTGVSGVATAVGQIPTSFTHISEINSIHNDRSLILHGAVFGANYNF